MRFLNRTKGIAMLALAMLFLSYNTMLRAQTGVPKGFNYQAVVRGSNGDPVASKTVSLRVRITDNTGSTVYWQEDFSPTTTAIGLVNVVIGTGTKSGGSKSKFADIPWASAPKMEVLLDASGGTSYTSMGTNGFWSVPFALVADSAMKGPGGMLNQLSDVSASGATTGQVLTWDGSKWKPATVSGGGGPISLKDLADVSVTGATAGQLLAWDGTHWKPVTVTSPSNLKDLSDVNVTSATTGQVLKWNGSKWVAANDDTAKAKMPTPGGDVSGSLNNLTVTRLQGRNVSSTAPTIGQILKWDGTQWKPADTSKGGGSSSPWTKSGTNVYYNGGNVGINTTSPANRLQIVENLSGKTDAVRVDASGGTSSSGIYNGIHSEIKNTGGVSSAVLGRATGSNSAGENEGLQGYASGAGNNIGVVGRGTGASTTNFNIGVFGHGDSSTYYNIGVEGDATASSTESSYGIYGSSAGTGSGTSTSANAGVHGEASGNANINNGVEGVASGSGAQNVGVLGATSSTGSSSYNIGVAGTAPSTGLAYAGYFQGNLQVNGTLAKSSGTFKIDHPMDPANKYLLHSFVESPDMMNIYNGNVTTGNDSVAVITLPHYFEVLNRDFRYQLTVIGDFAQAIVLKEVKDNQFVIKTNKANVKVSWQVTGVRQDPYAKAHPIIPEVDKVGIEKGKYLNPELYGQPEDKAMYKLMPGQAKGKAVKR